MRRVEPKSFALDGCLVCDAAASGVSGFCGSGFARSLISSPMISSATASFSTDFIGVPSPSVSFVSMSRRG